MKILLINFLFILAFAAPALANPRNPDPATPNQVWQNDQDLLDFITSHSTHPQVVTSSVIGSPSLRVNADQIRGNDGTAGAPFYSFESDLDSGVFSVKPGEIGISADATARITITTSQIKGAVPFRTESGVHSAAAPDFSFVDDTNTGMFRVAADRIGFATNGATRFQIRIASIESNIQHQFVVGSVSSLGLSFLGDPNTGIFSNSAEDFSIASAGVEVARFDDFAVSGNTRFLIYDVDNATLERVTVGSPNSGGGGFKLLRIPN